MGVPFKDLVVREPISLEDLSGKKLAIDAFNILFQFLSAIRQRDGTPLKDDKGAITSHLNGIFYRTVKLMQAGAKPCFVFDGTAPELKADTQAARREVRAAAKVKHEAALASGDMESARKYGQQAITLTSDMIKEAKELIVAMGLPVIQALGDAEAQAAYMARKGQVWAIVSQDYDSLLFGSPRVIRNLTVSQKKRGTKIISPEMIDLADTLNELKLDRQGLVDAAILIGTDFNSGIRGVGPKSAIKIAREGRFQEYEDRLPRFAAVRKIFLQPATTNSYTLEWKPLDVTAVKEILCKRHNFSEKRIDSAMGLTQSQRNKDQSSLADF
ncbi:flap endonuclease-1 [Candidatus Woesearchaeota archaeon]|jgi:flap endonuclease-1|nr:flap endonuclease-1 [Candidatus Woesearchaeota archaeon]MBT4114640.1 flap endonuclease-1 [Candidatus Woesearchaeota archaeon]MBT4248018.1 flap endonuclease-1 [Candidatus Woesearchaeota archaeon]